MQLLSDLGFNIKGYYAYDSITDIIGYLEAQEPLITKTKVILEVRTDQLSIEKINGFSKLSENVLADKRVLCALNEFDEISSEVQDAIIKSSIDYFGINKINKILEQKGKSSSEVAELSNACEYFSPKKLAEMLPELAKQNVPEILKKTLPNQEAWAILEDAVFGVFNFCLDFNTIQLGRQTLFQNEPEGKVICDSNGGHFGMIYDCKSSKTSYNMTKQDELTYINYILTKKNEFIKLHNCDLQYFLIISPEFSGDLQKRRDAVYKKTGVLIFFVEAEMLKKIALWAFDLPNNVKGLIDFSDFLHTNELKISLQTIDQNIERINGFRHI